MVQKAFYTGILPEGLQAILEEGQKSLNLGLQRLMESDPNKANLANWTVADINALGADIAMNVMFAMSQATVISEAAADKIHNGCSDGLQRIGL